MLPVSSTIVENYPTHRRDESGDQPASRPPAPPPTPVPTLGPVEQRIEAIIGRPVPEGWEDLFGQALNNLEHIYRLRAAKQHINSPTLAPREADIFRAFDLVRPENVHVILIAQDPYPGVSKDGEPVADGLAFSSRHGVQASLRGIINYIRQRWPREAEATLPANRELIGSLVGWAKQGVLLLNASLTTEQRVPGAHGHLWYIFLQNVIGYLKQRAERGQVMVVLRLGREAQRIRGLDSSLGLCLDTGHPSPMNRNPRTAFHGGVLVQANEYLVEHGLPPIDWWRIE